MRHRPNEDSVEADAPIPVEMVSLSRRAASRCYSVRGHHGQGPLPAGAVSRLLAKTRRSVAVVVAVIHGYGNSAAALDVGAKVSEV